MGNIDFNNIWKTAKREWAEKPRMSREEIDGFRLSRSGQISAFIRKAIWTSMVTFFILLLLLVTFAFVSKGAGNFFTTLVAVMLSICFIIGYHINLLIKAEKLDNFSETISSRFDDLRRFFRIEYPLFQVIASLSSPVFVATGVLYYKYKKYSEVVFSDTEDILVMLAILALSFIISFFANRFGSSATRREVDDLLAEDIYDDEYFAIYLERERLLRRSRIMVITFIAILGLLLLAVMIILNFQ